MKVCIRRLAVACLKYVRSGGRGGKIVCGTRPTPERLEGIKWCGVGGGGVQKGRWWVVCVLLAGKERQPA